MSNYEAIYNNISALNKKLRATSEQYAAHIAELAYILSESDPESYAEAREKLAESILIETLEGAKCNSQMLQDVFGIADIIVSSVLTSEIAEKNTADLQICPDYSKNSSKIAYYRTHGADSAYRFLSKCLPFPTVEYTESFSSVCDEVYSGYCDFGILPIKSKEGGRINAIDRLIRQNSLFIAAVCDIKDSDDMITFALLSKNQVKLEGASVLDFDYTAFDGFSLTSILTSMSIMGAYPSSCSNVPGDDDTLYRIELEVSTESLKKVLTLLDREYPDFRINGFYKKVQVKQ